MQDAVVIDEYCIERLDQIELSRISQAIDADLRGSGLDVLAFDKENSDPINPVAVHALRCRMSGGQASFYAELMHLDFESRSTDFEDRNAEVEQVGKDWIFKRGLLHLSKPARYPAIERIIVPALVMGARGEQADIAICQSQHGMAPPPIASTICHIAVGTQSVPACTEGCPTVLVDWSEQTERRGSSR